MGFGASGRYTTFAPKVLFPFIMLETQPNTAVTDTECQQVHILTKRYPTIQTNQATFADMSCNALELY